MNEWGFDYQFERKFTGGVMLISMDNQNVKVDKEKEAYGKCTANFDGQSKYESW